MPKLDPVFLVVVDDSEEMHQALQFACGRAKAVNGRVALLYAIAPAEFEYWAGVGELMRQEAREAAEAKMAIHAEYAQKLTGNTPMLHVREGDIRDELLALIDEHSEISLLVLGADTNSETAGPLITFLMARGASRCRVPITVVPGNLSDEAIDALF
ncbi:universal stress protein [Alphaproteobacteria bacterium]|jgi:nucleotide-binding universal stress UspA family protein|nr:universal stress protein [Alphaproteobacteria bacterium]MDB3892304.1 universal stress protein [Alphaproteobacteria bacterium]